MYYSTKLLDNFQIRLLHTLKHIRDKSRGSRDFIPIKGSTNDALILRAEGPRPGSHYLATKFLKSQNILYKLNSLKVSYKIK